MKSLLWLVLLAVTATATAVLAYGNGGYALLVLPPWRVEISLNLLPIVLILAFGLFYLMLRTYSLLHQLPGRARAYQEQRQDRAAHEALMTANRLLFEGRVGQALKKASEAYLAGASCGLASLIAARAAQRMRNTSLVEPWVERARRDDPECEAAALMLLAETQIDQGRHQEALGTLKQLQGKAGRHFAALRLELRARQAVGDWDAVLRLARQLEKREAISSQYAQTMKQKSHLETLRHWDKDASALLAYLRKIPKEEKHPQIIRAAALTLRDLEANLEAQTLLENLLDEPHDAVWHETLVLLYGRLVGGDIPRRISRAEGWLKRTPRDAALLHCLGQLCQQQRLWGRAESYFEAALSICETPATHLALAELLEQLNRPEVAQPHYRAAALLVAR